MKKLRSTITYVSSGFRKIRLCKPCFNMPLLDQLKPAIMLFRALGGLSEVRVNGSGCCDSRIAHLKLMSETSLKMSFTSS